MPCVQSYGGRFAYRLLRRREKYQTAAMTMIASVMSHQ